MSFAPSILKASISRRQSLEILAGAGASALLALAATDPACAQGSRDGFERWVETFRARALKRGVSDATYTRVVRGLTPDNSVFAEIRNQPEFNQKLWQYLNRRVSDWRIVTGKEKAKEQAPLLSRIEQDYGVARGVILGLWGIESAYGDPDVQKNHM